MIAKWITCCVPNAAQKDFSHAQIAWQASQNSQGFAGQIGGWQSHLNKRINSAKPEMAHSFVS